MPRKSLSTYTQKRDLQRSPEPPAEAKVVRREGPLRFMVHKHSARRLHYDLRLELDGVLLSWAVPKGPSSNTRDRHLAVHVEDHPLDYALFEGVIPKGGYGAGPSMVWDAGTYSPDEDGYAFDDRKAAEAAMRAGLETGKLSFTLRGVKMKGSWTLVQTKTDWLLIKHRDAAADAGHELIAEDRSVASGLTIDELRDGVPPHRQLPSDSAYSPGQLPGSRQAPLGTFAPMLAVSDALPRDEHGWSFEPKLDGVRAIAALDHGEARISSRRGNNATRKYPGVAAAVAEQPASTAVFDGEIVAIGKDGRPSFELLQQRMNLTNVHDVAGAERDIPVTYFVFDLLYLDGYDLTRLPLDARREILRRVLLPMPSIVRVEPIDLSASEAFEIAAASGFEGIIAKRNSSPYDAGARSASWIKRKSIERESFLVGGFTPGQGSREATFGGLLIGSPTADGLLRYRGRVGSGFTDEELTAMARRLRPLVTPDSPFVEIPAIERGTQFVKPEVAVEVEHRGFTEAGILRAAVHKGLADEAPRLGMPVAARVSARAAEPMPPNPPRRSAGRDAMEAAVAEALRGQLESRSARMTLEGDGWRLPVTNLDKALWPAANGREAVTKRELLCYAIRVWPYAAMHLRDRLVTLSRYPDGVGGKTFYQRHWDDKRPAFVEVATIYSETDGRDRDFLMCNNIATLLWLCQLADIEWHVSFGRASAGVDAPGLGTAFSGSMEAVETSVLNYPDFLVFDLDPYIYAGHEKKGDEPQPNRDGYAAACEVASTLRVMLESLGLVAFPKSSGATGVHIYVPIMRTLEYSVVRAACNTLAAELASRLPKLTTMEWDTTKRRGRVFLDANQNARHKSLAAPYSPRAKPHAPVSLPMAWDELAAIYPPDLSFDDVLARLAGGDPWAGIFDAKQDIEAIFG
jgi:bifunctional non-homologous end joining protein LigD